MFLTLLLLLISQVRCEWVQISQQHYRKPYKPTHNFPSITSNEELQEYEGGKFNRIYVNQTLDTRKWNKGIVDKVAHKGIVRRVQPNLMEVGGNSEENDAFSVHNIDLSKPINQNYNSDKKSNVFEIPIDEEIKNYAFINDMDRQTEDTLHFVSSTEENKFTTLEKRPVIKHKLTRPQVPINKFENFNLNINQPNFDAQNVFRESFRKQKPNVYNVELKIQDKNNIRDHISKENNKLENKNSMDYANKGDSDNPNQKLQDSADPLRDPDEDHFKSTTENIHVNTVNKLKEIFIKNKDNNEFSHKFIAITHLNQLKPEFVTKDEVFDNDESEATITDDLANTYVENIEQSKANFESVLNGNENNVKDTTDKETINNPLKKMENIMKFMKVVAETISKNSHRSVNSKIKYLETLKDTILANIEYRINSMWPDDVPDARRRARAARGHVEIPSSESALMTISFLTFAVYLIKLVLQVIQTYKNKTMMVAPAVVATVGRTATAFTQTRSNK